MIKICEYCKKEYKSRGKIRNKTGKYCSKLCMSEMQKGKPTWNKGKKLDKKHIENLIKSHLGQKAWNKGKKSSEETRKKISNYVKANPVSWWKGKKRNKEAKEKMRLSKLQNPPKVFRDTSIEIKIENELIKRGIYYQKQVPLCKIARVDFYLPEYRIVIQADGCYWHNCPIHGKNRFTKSVEKDIKQDKVLTFNGFNVYRFWEHQINKSVEDCINSLNLNICL